MRRTLRLSEGKEPHIFEVNRQHKQTIQVIKDRPLLEASKKMNLPS